MRYFSIIQESPHKISIDYKGQKRKFAAGSLANFNDLNQVIKINNINNGTNRNYVPPGRMQ